MFTPFASDALHITPDRDASGIMVRVLVEAGEAGAFLSRESSEIGIYLGITAVFGHRDIA